MACVCESVCLASVISVCRVFAVIPSCHIALILIADLLTQPQKLKMHTRMCVWVSVGGMTKVHFGTELSGEKNHIRLLPTGNVTKDL